MDRNSKHIPVTIANIRTYHLKVIRLRDPRYFHVLPVSDYLSYREKRCMESVVRDDDSGNMNSAGKYPNPYTSSNDKGEITERKRWSSLGLLLVMVGGLNKLGTALTVIIVVTLLALVLEMIYVLWRRQRFCQDNESDLARETSCFPSDKLLCILCWKKNKSRVEPREASLPNSASSRSPPELEEQVMKWQCLYGPSRMLFTIKEEEEREDLEFDYCASASASASVTAEIEFESVMKTNRACFSELLSTVDRVETNLSEGEVAVSIELNETTPFSTPCGSPPYYTPSSSPLHEMILTGCPVHSAPLLK